MAAMSTITEEARYIDCAVTTVSRTPTSSGAPIDPTRLIPPIRPRPRARITVGYRRVADVMYADSPACMVIPSRTAATYSIPPVDSVRAKVTWATTATPSAIQHSFVGMIRSVSKTKITPPVIAPTLIVVATRAPVSALPELVVISWGVQLLMK